MRLKILCFFLSPKEKKKNAQGGEQEWRNSRPGPDFGPTENKVTISVGEQEAEAANALPKKERPVWMEESTIEGANTENVTSVRFIVNFTALLDVDIDYEVNELVLLLRYCKVLECFL